MKIGIMGTHGVGKTTLALKLASEKKQVYPSLSVSVMSEVARTCPLPINKQSTTESQSWIFHTQIVREIEACYRNDVVFCDRTVLDPLAYCWKLGHCQMVDFLLPYALNWVNTYDYIYFMRPNFKIVEDGVRDTDPDFQMGVDAVLRWWVRTEGIKVHLTAD